MRIPFFSALSRAGVQPRPAHPLTPVRLPWDERLHPHPLEWWYFTAHLRPVASPGARGMTVAFVVLKEDGVLPGTPLVALVHRIDYERGPLPLICRVQTTANAYRDLDPPRWFGLSFRPETVGLGDPRAWGIEGGMGIYRLRLEGTDGLELRLQSTQGPVLLGHEGLFQYRDGERLAYYAWPHLVASGRVTLDGAQVDVTGPAWMEHQWGQARVRSFRWKYLPIQLDDGERWMVFRVEHLGSHAPDTVFCGRIRPDGSLTQLDPSGVQLEDLPPRYGAYPIRSRVRLRTPAVELVVTPRFARQDVRPAVPGVPPFWEGACEVEGTVEGRPVKGVAMTELTHYEA